jgi:hypothetical protein
VVGTILAADFRLLGLGKNRQTPAQLSESVFAWNRVGFGIALLCGFLLFACRAETYLRNPAFLVKIDFLVSAWTDLARRRTTKGAKLERSPGPMRSCEARRLGRVAALVASPVRLSEYLRWADQDQGECNQLWGSYVSLYAVGLNRVPSRTRSPAHTILDGGSIF